MTQRGSGFLCRAPTLCRLRRGFSGGAVRHVPPRRNSPSNPNVHEDNISVAAIASSSGRKVKQCGFNDGLRSSDRSAIIKHRKTAHAMAGREEPWPATLDRPTQTAVSGDREIIIEDESRNLISKPGNSDLSDSGGVCHCSTQRPSLLSLISACPLDRSSSSFNRIRKPGWCCLITEVPVSVYATATGFEIYVDYNETEILKTVKEQLVKR